MVEKGKSSISVKENGTCPVHNIKCQQWEATEKKVDLLERSKLGVRVFQVVIGIFLAVGGAYWYNEDAKAGDHFEALLKLQADSTKALTYHIRTSNIILKNMSHDVREVKLNQQNVLKKLDLDYQEIPGYYGGEDWKEDK